MTRTATKHHRRTITVLAVAALVAPIAGCATPPAGATGPAPAASSAPNLPGKDITRWVMPLDTYSTAVLVPLSNYAENRRMEACLSKEGLLWPIPVEPTDDASYLTLPKNMSSFPALTVSIAKQSGYTANYNPGIRLEDEYQTFTRLNRIAETSPGFEPVFKACVDESRKSFDVTKVTDIANTMSMWQHEGSQGIPKDPAVKKAAASWKQCITAAGYDVSISAPVSDEEEWMPTEKLGVELGFFAPPPSTLPTDGRTYGDTEVDPDAAVPRTPTPAEIALAVADATCRDSSDWTKAYYDAQWNAEIEIVRSHAAQLATMKADIETLTAQARQIIADNPPLH